MLEDEDSQVTSRGFVFSEDDSDEESEEVYSYMENKILIVEQCNLYPQTVRITEAASPWSLRQ